MTSTLERLLSAIKSTMTSSIFTESTIESIAEFNELVEVACTDSLLLITAGHQPIKAIKFSFEKMKNFMLEHDILVSHNLKDRFYIFKQQ